MHSLHLKSFMSNLSVKHENHINYSFIVIFVCKIACNLSLDGLQKNLH